MLFDDETTSLPSATIELLEGGHFGVLRSHDDHELFPDAIGVPLPGR